MRAAKDNNAPDDNGDLKIVSFFGNNRKVVWVVGNIFQGVVKLNSNKIIIPDNLETIKT